MGQRILDLALKEKSFQISCLMENKNRPEVKNTFQGFPVYFEPAALKGSHVLIEFTTPEATLEHVKACQKHGVKMVIGTTGLSPAQIAQIKKAATKVPIVFSSNMSVGVNIVFG